jgi:hypothetical protein
VSLPAVKPFAVVGAIPLSVALPLVNAVDDASTTPPIWNDTVPPGVPLLDVTVAVRLWVAVVLPSAMEVGVTVTEVVVGIASTVTLVLPWEAAYVVLPL